MTHYEKLMNGTKEDMINELVLAIKWAHELPAKDWNCIKGDLKQFVRDVLNANAKEDT